MKILLVLVLLAAGGFAGYRWSQRGAQRGLTLPPANHTQGKAPIPKEEWLNLARDIEARLKAIGSTNSSAVR